MMRKEINLLFFILVFVTSCQEKSTPDAILPIYGHKELDTNGDTIYHTVEDFEFTNQDGVLISKKSTHGEVYIADYFFTHCPTMCPAMTGQMKRVRKALPEITILTHTCDPKRDSAQQLKRYVEKRGIDTDNWHFLTGDKEALYTHGFYSYMMTTDEDILAPGGFMHSPYFAIVDRDHRVRGMYDGTNTEQVDQLIVDAKSLINSYSNGNH
ncbi:MAG: SCO family protein [Crocinitomicaceae bacterium]|jgi:protein SCO1|nr:SCO family protein [Crocinitomicaceae bacterium]MBT6030629.1 SCO family protein [Crocinitomicaceae bacterium]